MFIILFVRIDRLVMGLLFCVLLAGAPIIGGQTVVAVSGKVLDPSGAGISGAFVILQSLDRVLSVRTDQNGEFKFASVPPGKYTLETSATGFIAKTIEAVEIIRKTVRPLMITLNIRSMSCGADMLYSVSYEEPVQGSAALIGIVRILDEHRSPLAMAKLALSKEREIRVLAEQTTNDKGEFQFSDLKPGKYVLRASREGYTYLSGISIWITRENRTRLTIEMYEKGRVFVCQ
jgi:uncharacterized surface anchored protein